MKRILFSIILITGSVISRAQVTQVVDLSTGIVNGTGAAAAVCSVDDTWTYSWSGHPYSNLLVSNNYYDYTDGGVHTPGQYVNASCARWISPVVNTTSGTYYGMMEPANSGEHSYKMTFTGKNCTPTGATLNISYAAADNSMDSISINGFWHNLASQSISFSSLKTFTLSIAPAKL